jgi:hypothetical protein
MVSIGGTPQIVTVNLQQVQDLDLENTAKFDTAADKLAFQQAVASAKDLRDNYGIANPTIQIPLPTNAAQLGLTADKLEKTGDDTAVSITDLMVMLHQLGVSMRQAGKEVRAATRDAEVATIESQAEKIKAAGAFALAAGLTGGLMQIGGGLMSGLGTIRAANTASGANQELVEPTGKLDSLKQKLFYADKDPSIGPRAGVNDDGSARFDDAGNRTWSMDQVKTLGGQAERTSARWNASSQVIQGLGNSVKAGLEYGSNQADQAKAKLEAQSKELSYLVQNQDDIVNNMRDMIADVRQKLSEIEQANNASISKIWS